MISRIRFASSFDTEYGHWGFDLQLPSIRLRYVNFKNSAPAGSLQLTVGLLLWSVWLAVFFDKKEIPQ
jgi:hypothetical protein